jgi:hypothetical protein
MRSTLHVMLMPRTVAPGGSIHIEFPGRAMISMESNQRRGSLIDYESYTHSS